MAKRKAAVISYAKSSEEEETKPSAKILDEKKIKKSETSDESDSEKEISPYEQLRLKNIEERDKLLRSLGIGDALKELKEVTRPIPKRKSTPKIKTRKEPLPKREPSKRLRKLTVNPTLMTSYNSGLFLKSTQFSLKKTLPRRGPSRRLRKLASDSYVDIEQEIEYDEPEIDSRFTGSLPMKLENDESEELLKRLALVKRETKFEPDFDLKSCDISSFQQCMMGLRVTRKPLKVVPQRIQSILTHPTVNKQLAIIGDASGYLGFLDLEVEVNEELAGIQKVHDGPINCISVSSTDESKIFTTGQDGAFVCADLEQKIFSNLYATDFTERYHHLKWHDQVDANRILLTHGNGSVGVLDLREANMVNTWIPCFDRSARTVQHHPLKNEYFLVSSGAGQSCNVYDIRSCSNKKAEPVSEMSHPKALFSAFFSPSGDYIVSTCNDDFLRIYSSPLEIKPRCDRKISHNNHTKLLSVFKAMWHPARSDVFMIGSLLSPRRIQLYGLEGTLVGELKSEHMTTITSLISAHPTLPFIVGGNSSGRVFTFTSDA